jgi:hypothetical protein
MGLTDQVASFGSPNLCRINEERADHKGARICVPGVTELSWMGSNLDNRSQDTKTIYNDRLDQKFGDEEGESFFEFDETGINWSSCMTSTFPRLLRPVK